MINDNVTKNKKWVLPLKNDPGKIGILKKILKSFSFRTAQAQKKRIENDDDDSNDGVTTIGRKSVSFDESVYCTATENKNKTKNNETDPILCKVKIFDTATVNKVVIKDIDASANTLKQNTTISEYGTPNSTTTNFDDINKLDILEDLSVKKGDRSGIYIGEEYERDFVKAIEGVKTSTIAKRNSAEQKDDLVNFFKKNHLEEEKIHKKLYHNKKEEDKFIVNLYESYGRKRRQRIRPAIKINNNGTIKKIDDKPLCVNTTMEKLEIQKEPSSKTDTKMYEFLSLKQEADVQCEIMRQASKGLEICKNSRNSLEQVELERVLLIASYKHHAIIEQIRENEYSEIYQDENRSHNATVSIKNLKFPLKREPKKSTSRRSQEWFVCILSSGTETLFTKATKSTNSDSVFFEENFVFENLKSNFAVNVSLYSMVVQKRKISNPLKKRNVNDASYKKFFHKSVHNYEAIKSDIRISSFRRLGFTQLKRADFFKGGPRVLQNVQCSIVGTFTADLKVEKVDIYAQHCGFLTISTKSKGSTVWNRKWCVLDKTKLRFWNSPTEEGLNREVLSLDLQDSLEPFVLTANRNTCPRPRTIILKFGKTEETSTKHRVFLSADTMDEMETWKRELSAVVKSLAKWKMLNYIDDIIV